MIKKMPVGIKEFINICLGGGGNSANNKKKKFEEELEKLKNEYESPIDKAVNEEYKAEYLKKDKTSDEELEKRAKEKSDYVKGEKIAELKEDKALAEDVANKAIEKEKVAAEVDKRDIEDSYERAKEGAENDAIKRGIARSSIIASLLKDYDLNKLDKQERRDRAAENKIENYQKEIGNLESKLNSALADLDMETAFNLNEEIIRLKKERDDENDKVTRYNNEVDDKIARYRNELLKSERGKRLEKEDEDKLKERSRKITDLMFEYYDGLSYDEAQSDFENGDYDEILTEKDKKYIKNYLLRRKFENENK